MSEFRYDPERGAVSIDLAGNTRWLRYTTAALIELEEVSGEKTKETLQKVFAILSRMQTGMEQVRAEMERLKAEGRRTEEIRITELGIEAVEEEVEFSTKSLAQLLWSGLLHEQPDITLSQVYDLMDESTDEHGRAIDDTVLERTMCAFLSRTAPKTLSSAVIEMFQTIATKVEEAKAIVQAETTMRTGESMTSS